MAASAGAAAIACGGGRRPIAILTLDDAVKSHRSFAAPLLADYGFGATFFLTHRWMHDAENFLTWDRAFGSAQLSLTGGQSVEYNTSEDMYMQGEGFVWSHATMDSIAPLKAGHNRRTRANCPSPVK